MLKPNFPIFIDRTNFNNLQDKNFALNDYPNLLVKGNSCVSLLTTCYLINLNRLLNNIIYSSSLDESYYSQLTFLSDKERTYIDDTLKYNLIENKSTLEKYYDITVLEDNTILVIVEDGFLSYVMENKENLLKFFLDYLHCSYKYGLSLYYVMKVYLKLKLQDAYFELIKSRIV